MAGVHLVFLSRTLKALIGIGEDSRKKKIKRCLKDVTDEPSADDLSPFARTDLRPQAKLHEPD